MVTLEAILERNNLNRAYKQVKANRGGPGVDGMTVDELLDYLRAHAVEIVETVKAGKYKPQPVRRVMIPKEEKGKFRPLGIPTAVDRVIQQAIAQKLSDEYEPVFSLHPKSRSKPSRYSSENDVLIEKSVKYTDFFLLSMVYA